MKSLKLFGFWLWKYPNFLVIIFDWNFTVSYCWLICFLTNWGQLRNRCFWNFFKSNFIENVFLRNIYSFWILFLWVFFAWYAILWSFWSFWNLFLSFFLIIITYLLIHLWLFIINFYINCWILIFQHIFFLLKFWRQQIFKIYFVYWIQIFL